MKTIRVRNLDDIPENFTGVAEWKNGYKEWYKDELLHKDDGPAVEWPSGTKFWYINGKKHRTDGPAMEWSDGNVEYFINGERTYKEAVEVYRALFSKQDELELI